MEEIGENKLKTKQQRVEWLKNNMPKEEKAKRMFLMNRKQAQQNQTPPIIENDITKKKFINKDSIIVSALCVIIGMVGFWYIRWNFNEIFISLVLFGGLLKLILELYGKYKNK